MCKKDLNEIKEQNCFVEREDLNIFNDNLNIEKDFNLNNKNITNHINKLSNEDMQSQEIYNFLINVNNGTENDMDFD